MDWYEQRLEFPVDALEVVVRREGSSWVVDTRLHREGGTWERRERYTRLTLDEATDVAFATMASWPQ